MNVRQLIEALQQHDPEMPVEVYSFSCPFTEEVESVTVETYTHYTSSEKLGEPYVFVMIDTH